MNTFTQLKEIIGENTLNITVSQSDETMSVMTTIGGHTPVIISGTPQEIDENFFEALKEKSTATFTAEAAEVEEEEKPAPKKKPEVKTKKGRGKPADTELSCPGRTSETTEAAETEGATEEEKTESTIQSELF